MLLLKLGDKMYKPIVAVVGRPNVGKSTFFNRVCGRRISIVDDTPGVTRDRLYADANWQGYTFSLVDTGGIDRTSSDEFQNDIKQQAILAIQEADVIVFMVDGKSGLTTNDFEVSRILHKSNRPIVLVVNKLDNFEIENTYEFYNLGLGDPYPLSLAQGKGLGDILDEIVKHFKDIDLEKEDINAIKVAIVGRPNVGKSSLINRLVNKERVVVSDIEGTTRDSVYVPFRYDRQDFALIDTAGLRKQKVVDNGTIESYSVLRTMSAIDDCDIALIVVDGGKDKITEQDVKVAGYVHESGKPSVIVVNKWDIKSKDKNSYLKMLQSELSFMSYFNVIFVSALTGEGLGQIMKQALISFQNASKRIQTSVLNDFLHEAILYFEPQARSGNRAKIKYITQTSTNPPTFVIFVNDAKLINFSYKRYLENKLRESVDFSGTPIKLVFKGKGDE